MCKKLVQATWRAVGTKPTGWAGQLKTPGRADVAAPFLGQAAGRVPSSLGSGSLS